MSSKNNHAAQTYVGHGISHLRKGIVAYLRKVTISIVAYLKKSNNKHGKHAQRVQNFVMLLILLR